MKLGWKMSLRVGVSIFILFLCIHYWDSLAGLLGLVLAAATPLVMGCVFAYILNIPMSFYERHYFTKSTKAFAAKTRRPVCMLLAFFSIAAVIVVMICIVAPELSKCIMLLLTNVVKTLERIGDYWAKSPWLSEGVRNALSDFNWKQSLSSIIGSVFGGIGSAGNYAVEVISVIATVTANGLIGLIFSIYILAGKERLGRQLRILEKRYLKPSWIERISHVLEIADDSFHRYIVGQCTEAIILGTLCTVGMVILRLPYAAVVGVTVGFTALIPVAGAYIGAVVGFLLILTVSPAKAVLFAVYLGVLQQLEGNIIYPRVVGTSLGLPGIWVLAAVMVGGGINGIGGMIIGVPLCACLYRLVQEDVRKKTDQKETDVDF